MDDGIPCVLNLVIVVICGIAAAAIASHKGRSAVGWFWGGFFLGVIGIIIVAVLSNKKEEQARQEYVHMEQRRLREQLRQEQLKVESLRRYSEARLDAHDRALGIETRNPAALPDYQPVPQALPAGTPMALPGDPGNALADPARIDPVAPAVNSSPWYYEYNGASIGPINLADLQKLFLARRIRPNTLVWNENLTDWTPADSVPAFREVTSQ